jgi:hypothetical protein
MSVKNSVVITRKHFHLQNRSKRLYIPQYHILILAWCALFILYGETGLSPPPFQTTTKNYGYLSAAYR